MIHVITSFLEIKLAKNMLMQVQVHQNKLILNFDPVVPLKANSAFLKRVSPHYCDDSN